MPARPCRLKMSWKSREAPPTAMPAPWARRPLWRQPPWQPVAVARPQARPAMAVPTSARRKAITMVAPQVPRAQAPVLPASPAAVSWMWPAHRLAPVAARALALRVAWADLACWARSAALAWSPPQPAVAEAVAPRLAVPAPEAAPVAARGQAARVVPEAARGRAVPAAQVARAARAARPAVARAINPPPPS
ncbi:hypothetical protein JAB6_39810 [Janthinobacterium sp. HH104]|nr:hypothetical protein JAB6_39810 [Janthinobacterium sp. HH104]